AADQRRDQPRSGPGEEDAVSALSQPNLLLHANQELECLFSLLGVVALVIAPEHFAPLDDHRLDRRRAHIHADRLHVTCLAWRISDRRTSRPFPLPGGERVRACPGPDPGVRGVRTIAGVVPLTRPFGPTSP